MEYTKISAEDARKEVDRLIEAENAEPHRELNEIYGAIHKAIRDKQYCILVEIRYESTIFALKNNGYKVTVVGTKTVQDLGTNREYQEYGVVDVRVDWRK